MRTTFSCLLYVLLVAACWTQVAPDNNELTLRLLKQAVEFLKQAIKEKDIGMLLHSPTNDIKECCSQSALQCFKNGSTIIKSQKRYNKLMMKLDRNLSKLVIMKSTNTCTEEKIKNVTCMSCDSYPMVNSKEFLTNLLSHLQKAYTLKA